MTSANQSNAYANKIGIALILLIFAAYIGFNIEAYEEEVYSGAGAQAYQEPFLAMQRHLAQYDINSQTVEDLNKLFSP